MPCDSLVRARYRLTVRHAGTSRVRAILDAGPGAVRILNGRITPEDAILDVEVCSRPEELPRIESALSREADIARTGTA